MRTLIVGDVHACSHELDALLRETNPNRVVLVGDLFTKGPDPVGVWERIRIGGFESVLGNHDARLLQAARGKRRRDVHAHRVVQLLTQADQHWQGFVASLPLFIHLSHADQRFTVVHAGMHPSGRRKKTRRRTALHVRKWPRDKAKHPYWWQVYQGKRGVLYGHDAKMGLNRVVRKGLPDLIGLDSGCVYGNPLSGYLLEAGRIVQVPAHRVYCPVRRSTKRV